MDVYSLNRCNLFSIENFVTLSIGYPNATIDCEVEPKDVVSSKKQWDMLTSDGQYARLHKAAYDELEDHINVFCSEYDEDDDEE
jgi:hypothetical protein